MKQFKLILVSICLFVVACKNTKPMMSNLTSEKDAVLQTEMEFEKMAATKGIAEAFLFYADSNAVINRGNDSLIYGKKGIYAFYNNPATKSATLNWHPDFVEVSASGDLAYTYGKYRYQNIDASGKVLATTGIFHTVWKKKADGTWRFVWD